MSGITTNLLFPTPDTVDAGKDVIVSDALSLVDRAMSEASIVDISSGDVILSDEQFGSALIQVIGSLTANRVLEFPMRRRVVLVLNATSGIFTLSARSGAVSAAIVIPVGALKHVWIKDQLGNLAVL
jgi:hypothetical protein